MDLSNHVSELHECLVKVLIGTNEENVKLARHSLMKMYGACKNAPNSTVEYLRKVWNGKEGKIAQASTKSDLLSVFGAFLGSQKLRNCAVEMLCACGEKETTEMVLGSLFKALNTLTSENADQAVINALFDAIQKQSKSSGAGLYGFISALYGQIRAETIAFIDKPKLQLLYQAYEKVKKNLKTKKINKQ